LKKHLLSYVVLFAFIFFGITLLGDASADSFRDMIVKNNLAQQLYTPNGDTAIGNTTHPKVIVVDFFDNYCPACREVSGSLEQVARNNPNVEIIFKDLAALGESSELPARAALSAAKQNKYSAMHHGMMKSNTYLDEAKLKELAKKISLDMKQFLGDINSPSIHQQLEKNTKLSDDLQINAVPTLFIANAKILKNPTSVPQYRWEEAFDGKKFHSLLQQVAAQ
jgi:protein-disulfide isomerase